MVLEFFLTTEDHVAFNEHVARTSPVLRKQRATARIVGAVLCGATSLGIAWAFERSLPVALVTGLLTAVVMWFLLPRILWRSLLRSIRKMVAKGLVGPVGEVRVTLAEDGLTVQISGMTSSLPWASIEGVAETEDHYFVFASPVAAIVVPRRVPGAAELIDAVRAASVRLR
ncbi:YcxB family protein [Sanguibacter sp. HDW7]|uniref:YcxB family protein n=1 Tax=Sanguibacter sp. HDW7 TaxID=2714931 RepID=UPI001407C065|nr:YcxB family protein [Sanguibacter sp. HDW7]QIK83683.1 YcxB family protein [Sanguibacter sp. HDW7]